MKWIAIRSVYHFGINKNGKNVFEERVVVFNATDFEEAHTKGESEAELYAKENEFILHPEQVAYKQDGEKLIDGYEVWSELFEADVDIYEFYKERYEKYVYRKENA